MQLMSWIAKLLGFGPLTSPREEEQDFSLYLTRLEDRQVLNADLDGLVASLAGQGLMPTIYRLDIWTAALRFFSNGPRYGFTNISGSAQGNSVNPDQYLFLGSSQPSHDSRTSSDRDRRR